MCAKGKGMLHVRDVLNCRGFPKFLIIDFVKDRRQFHTLVFKIVNHFADRLKVGKLLFNISYKYLTPLYNSPLPPTAHIMSQMC